MSAMAPLLGYERTLRGYRAIDVDDPKQTSDAGTECQEFCLFQCVNKLTHDRRPMW